MFSVLNCVRLLTRILPYIFEDPDWRGFFWSTLPGQAAEESEVGLIHFHFPPIGAMVVPIPMNCVTILVTLRTDAEFVTHPGITKTTAK